MGSERIETLAAEDHQNAMKKSKRKKKRKELAAPENPPEKLNVTVEVMREDPHKVSPLVGYFPTGFNPIREDGGGGDSELPPVVRVFRNTRKTGRLQLVVSPNDSKVDFVGTNYAGEAAYPQVCTYGLGVLDKEKRTLKVFPIAANKIFRLEPKVGGSGVSEEEQPSVNNELTVQEKAAKMNELTDRYGTNKARTKAKKQAALRQSEDPVAEKYLGTELEGVVANKDALESTTSHSSRNIPPYDLSATIPHMAYPLDKIILKGEWDYLLDVLELLQGGEKLSCANYPSFVCNRIYKLDDTETDEEKQQLACIFSYITHLLKFRDQHSMDGASSAKHHKIPKILSQKFSSMFSDPGSKWLTNEKNDLLISYVLVLTLFADDFRTEPSDIAKDLRTTAITLRAHYDNLGCKLVRQNNVSYATLPVPLQFPKLKTKRRR